MISVYFLVDIAFSLFVLCSDVDDGADDDVGDDDG